MFSPAWIIGKGYFSDFKEKILFQFSNIWVFPYFLLEQNITWTRGFIFDKYKFTQFHVFHVLIVPTSFVLSYQAQGYFESLDKTI